MSDIKASESRERVLKVAERLFSERGFASVTLKDIANELGMRQASLYYHVPDGKEALFVEVTERGLQRHRSGLEEAIAQAGSDLEQQLNAAAGWLLSQPSIDLGRMMKSDMPSISEGQAERLATSAYDSLIGPVKAAFERAFAEGYIRKPNFGNVGGAFLAIVEAIHHLPDHYTTYPKQAMVAELIDFFLNGLRKP